MKDVLHKIGSVLMAVVVLFSTLSFTVDMHYCGDTLVDTSIFSSAKTCGMEMGQTRSNVDCSIVKDNCCSTDQLKVEGQDELDVNILSFSTDQHFFITSFVYTYLNLFEGVDADITTYRDYTPPLVSREIYKLDETYLI